ncbi:MAG: molybdenum cofactor guanylyltransferase [Nitrospirota bacterium]|nr:MAG: molybdenum cofactor guanylyltransferase [Nitrospirota bacterium]
MGRKIDHISGVLLAGGKSRRMGQDKRHLMISGKSLFNHALHVLESVFSEIIIVVDTISSVVSEINHRVVTDLIPDKGSAGGLFTGLTYSPNPQVFAVACDMPFLNPAVIKKICDMSDSTDVTMVKLSNGLHPMHSVYSKGCLPVLRRMIEADQLRLQDLLLQKELETKILGPEVVQDIDPQFKSFLNVNTPADVKVAERLILQ